jgi:hypothetical protein
MGRGRGRGSRRRRRMAIGWACVLGTPGYPYRSEGRSGQRRRRKG